MRFIGMQIKKQNMIDFALGFIKIIDEHIKTIIEVKIKYLSSLVVWVKAASGLLNFIYKKIIPMVRPDIKLNIIEDLPAFTFSLEEAFLLTKVL